MKVWKRNNLNFPAMTTDEMRFATAKTSVWWDIENCEVPKGLDPNSIVKNMRSALSKMNYCGPISICAYGDTNLIRPPLVQQALSSTAVSLNHVPAGAKDGSDKKILVDMLLWILDNPAPANVMLISGDRDFSYALSKLSHRTYNVLLAQPPRASAPLVAAAKHVWLWTSFASGGPPLVPDESSQHINNVPKGLLPQDTRRKPIQNGKRATTDSVNSCGSSVKSNAHGNNLALVSDKSENMIQGPVDSPEEVNEGKDKPNTDHISSLIDVVCQSQVVFDSHLSQPEALTDANKLQESVGEKDQPTETIVEPPQLLSQNTQENSFGKHVAIVNLSELQEKDDGDKDQPRETIVESKTVIDHCQVSQLKGKKRTARLSQSQGPIGSMKLQYRVVGKKDQPRETIDESKPNPDYVCQLPNVVSQSQIVFDAHLSCEEHTAMLSQPEALIDSKKLQETNVGEKSQLTETVAEVPFQSQNTQENSEYIEKDVALLNQSEVLTNSSGKLEEKDVSEKAQPIETLAEPQTIEENNATSKAIELFNRCNVLDQPPGATVLFGGPRLNLGESSQVVNNVPRGVLPQDIIRTNMFQTGRDHTTAEYVTTCHGYGYDMSNGHLSDQRQTSTWHGYNIFNAQLTDQSYASPWYGYESYNMSNAHLSDQRYVSPWCGYGTGMYNAQVTDQRHASSQTSFLVSRIAQTGVIAKPVQCNLVLKKQKKKVNEKVVGEKDRPRVTISEPKPKGYYLCHLCNVDCKSQNDLDSHLRGKKHTAAKLRQSETAIDSKKLKDVAEKDQPRATIVENKPNGDHVCHLCCEYCQHQSGFDNHLRSKRHTARVRLSEEFKKLQEKGVGIETIAENSFEKPVAMVNQSEKKLVDTRKGASAQTVVKTNELVFRGAQEGKEEVKTIVSDKVAHVLNYLWRKQT